MKKINRSWDIAHDRKVVERWKAFEEALDNLPQTREDLEGMSSSQVLWACGEWSLVLEIDRDVQPLRRGVIYQLRLGLVHLKRGWYEREAETFGLPAPSPEQGWKQYVNYCFRKTI